jgi:hypothetical protein
MQNLKLILALFLLLTGGGMDYAFSLDKIAFHTNLDKGFELSEDFQELSPSRISSTVDFFQKILDPVHPPILSDENSRESSSDKRYYSEFRFIEPGLGLSDIIFPFHTFL